MQIHHQNQAQLAAMMNYLTGQAEAVTGVYGVLPRIQMPQPPPVIKQEGDITLNNINVENSVIGAINTGNISQIDVSLTNIKNCGNEDLAENLKKFTEAILNTEEISPQIKNEIIEQLSFLSSQAELPKENQKLSIIKPILNIIEKSIENLPVLITLLNGIKLFFGC